VTERVHTSQIGDIDGVWMDHSQSGWQTRPNFITYMLTLREDMDPRPIAFMLDSYAAHRTEIPAAELGIGLHFIPPGLTDELQPLDISVFVVIKADARKLFHDRTSENPFLRRSKQDAVADLIAPWEFVGPCIIQEGWEIYVG
jgi:hypothetical protein